ncbi:MAG: DUF2062 domain-containing protein [Nanoarchaeota archaeon]|nr:DUF2062 domain-containing protein [Nanoarchaeota archaeon]
MIKRIRHHFSLKKGIKHHFHEVIKTKTDPHSIAIGFAIGTFISTLPTPGFNILLGVLVILIYERVSKIALFGSMAVWNPLTTPAVYYLSYRIGDMIFSDLPVTEIKLSLAGILLQNSRRFFVGNVILALSLSILSYFAVRKIAEIYQKRESNKDQTQSKSKKHKI